MDFVFVLLRGSEWEDIIVLLSEEDAINKSKIYTNARVEIFSKNNIGYTPTYDYYKNGELIKNSNSIFENKCVNCLNNIILKTI